MKYPKVTALVPEGEHFDESAIVNEGVWLTGKHVGNIEASLASYESTVSQLDSAIALKHDLETELSSTRQAADSAAAESATLLDTANARILELESENAALKEKPAGEFQNTAAAEDRREESANGKSRFHTSFDDEVAAYSGKKK